MSPFIGKCILPAHKNGSGNANRITIERVTTNTFFLFPSHLSLHALYLSIPKQLNELTQRLAQQHISLRIDDKAVEYLAEQGYAKEYGARPLKRVINTLVTVPVAHYLLQHPHIKEIHVAYKKNELVIS